MGTRILGLVGSLRAASLNRLLAYAAVRHSPAGITVEVFDGLAEVPLFNEDLDTAGNVPAPAQALRDAVTGADALLFVTPENNGTIPAVLKNAIDWTSRPFRHGAITGIPTAVVGTAGRHGGEWAHQDARKSARVAGAQVLDDLVLSIPDSTHRFAVTHPADDAEVAAALPTILTRLAAEATKRVS